MREAAIDALLLGTVINLTLFAARALLTYPWLILLTYALVYIFAFLLRLRLVVRHTTAVPEQDQSLESNSLEWPSRKVFIELLLSGGEHLGS